MAKQEACEHTSSRGHIVPTATYGKIPLKEIQKLAKRYLNIKGMRKTAYQNGQERLRHNLAINFTPSTATHNREGIHKSQLLPEE